MPTVAATMQRLGVSRPTQLAELSDDAINDLAVAIEQDLPGALGFIEEAAKQSSIAGGDFAYLSRSPGEMVSKDDWSTLVGYLSRIFASPFEAVAQEITMRRHCVEVAFVNCCMIVAQRDRVDGDRLFQLQTEQQLTPDC